MSTRYKERTRSCGSIKEYFGKGDNEEANQITVEDKNKRKREKLEKDTEKTDGVFERRKKTARSPERKADPKYH